MKYAEYQSCIDACNSCVAACEYCTGACLREDDVGEMAACIKLNLDCAQMCQLVVSLMARESEYAMPLCQACAEICQACAAECGKHAHAHCQRCAQACRHCAEECARMVA